MTSPGALEVQANWFIFSGGGAKKKYDRKSRYVHWSQISQFSQGGADENMTKRGLVIIKPE